MRRSHPEHGLRPAAIVAAVEPRRGRSGGQGFVAPGGVPAPAVAAREDKPDLFLLATIGAVLASVWRLQNIVPGLAQLQFPMITLAGATGLFVLTRDRRRQLRQLRGPLVLLLCAYLGVIAVSVVAGIYPGNTFRFLSHDYIKTFLLTVLVMASIRSMKDIRLYAIALVAGGAAYSLSILARFRVGASGRLDELLYYDANDLAMVLVITLPLAVFFTRPGSRPLTRLLGLGAFGVIVVAMVKSGSRGGFLGFAAVLLFTLLFMSALPKTVRLRSTGLLVIGFALIGNQRYWEMMSTILRPSQDYNFSGQSESGRMETWKRGIGYFVERPILGVGAANFAVAEGWSERSRSRAELGKGTKAMVPHSILVQSGAELGAIGLAIFVGFFVVAFRTLKGIGWPKWSGPARARVWTEESAFAQALTASLLGFVVCGIFLSQAYSPYLHVLLAITFGLVKIRHWGAQAPVLQAAPVVTRRSGGGPRFGGARVPRPA